jgi:hypothetical protein
MKVSSVVLVWSSGPAGERVEGHTHPRTHRAQPYPLVPLSLKMVSSVVIQVQRVGESKAMLIATMKAV